MVPSPQSISTGGVIHSPEKRLEILHQGYYYDVTDFIKRHPGGSVLKFYTEEGEDATQAIEQVHHRSINKINLILKSFKKRPAGAKDYPSDQAQLKKHRALTEDFTKLFLEAQAEGLFEPSYPHIVYRLLQILVFYGVGLWLQSYPSLWVNLFGAFSFGMAVADGGFWMHEGGHNSMTGNPKWDKILQSFLMGFFPGVSGTWWNFMHNRHHAMPQRLNHDVDLDTMPLIAFHAKVVKDPKLGKSFSIQNQVWLLLSVDLFLVLNLWSYYQGPKSAFKNRNYFDLSVMIFRLVFLYYFMSFPMLVVGTWVAAVRLFGNFTLNHTWLPITEEHTHWVEYSLVHTADISDNWLVDWWMGYLNYQVEHHLFPTMPQFKNHLIKDRVKALAKKHGLPYHHYEYFEACRRVFKNLYKVSKELKQA